MVLVISNKIIGSLHIRALSWIITTIFSRDLFQILGDSTAEKLRIWKSYRIAKAFTLLRDSKVGDGEASSNRVSWYENLLFYNIFWVRYFVYLSRIISMASRHNCSTLFFLLLYKCNLSYKNGLFH